jgi:uncharacterized protein YbjT (DUF2867 family)
MSDMILVTGVTGNVGKEVINRLIGKGLPVKAAARNLAKAEAADLKETKIVLFDYDRPDTFEPALAGAGRLFVIPPPVNPRQHELIMPLIDVAAQTGVKHIVNLSTMGAENNETLPLRIAEKYLENSGIAYTLLRPNWFMQNCNGFMREGIKAQGGIYLPADGAKTSYIDIRDIAAVSVAALTTEKHLNKVYTLTGGKALDHYEMAKILSDVTGKNIQYFPMSDEDMRGALKSVGWTDKSIGMLIDLYRSAKQGGTEYVSPDVANILGREPITFEQYARDYAESWK